MKNPSTTADQIEDLRKRIAVIERTHKRKTRILKQLFELHRATARAIQTAATYNAENPTATSLPIDRNIHIQLAAQRAIQAVLYNKPDQAIKHIEHLLGLMDPAKTATNLVQFLDGTEANGSPSSSEEFPLLDDVEA